MAEAKDLVQIGELLRATTVIQDALRGVVRVAPVSLPVLPAAAPRAQGVLKIVRPLLGSLTATRGASVGSRQRAPLIDLLRTVASATDVVPGRRQEPGSGRFIERTFASGGFQGRYKLYVPGEPAPGKAPLVVLLHGCAQDPDDFAAGTGMNLRAEQQGFHVLYPAQSMSANRSRCWNWFHTEDQRRDKGEPGLIAAMTREVVETWNIDAERVYVAGLSAGGAMAAIVASQYPELFAAVGVHSGVPAGAASNLTDAVATMRTGARRGRTATPQRPVPTIVFHGDGDTTVHPVNGQSLIEDAVRGSGASVGSASEVVEGVSPRGKRYTVSSHRSQSGAVIAEHWVVHDSPHAWSGGSCSGSFTDMDGPSATDEMLRFFDGHDPRQRGGLHG